jgi:hypothetical protein
MPIESERQPEQRPKYEGPFKHRSARSEGGEEARPHRSRWLSPVILYAAAMIAGMLIAVVYVSKMTVTPQLIRASRETPVAPLPPRANIAAFCLSLASGVLRRIEPSPFCTEAAPPACRHGDTLQLTYSMNGAKESHVTAVVMGPDFAPATLTEGLPVREGASETPLGQWKVTSLAPRRTVALLAFFSREPIVDADLAPWWHAWRTGLRLLERPPPLNERMIAKGATLEAYRICIGN